MALTETQLRQYGYRENRETEAHRRRIKGLVARDLRDRETELRELMDRLGAAYVAVYEVPAESEDAEQRLEAAREIDKLVDETARAVRLGKAAMRYLG